MVGSPGCEEAGIIPARARNQGTGRGRPSYSEEMMPNQPPRSSALVARAREVAARAYSPYSGWQVGAAVVFAEHPESFVGANVENGSYGLTICGERAAIFAGVAAGGRKLEHVALTCRDRNGRLIAKIAPCGACLQVIAEFGSADTVIEIDGRGTFRLADFLPRPFEADPLKD
jgi:cytidine deaminase